MAGLTESIAKGSRSRVLWACEPCKRRKKRCDGTQPCATCVKFRYDCCYSPEPHVRLKRALRRTAPVPKPAPPRTQSHDSTAHGRELHVEQQSQETLARRAVSYAAASEGLVEQLQPHNGHGYSPQLSHVPTAREVTVSPTSTSALSVHHMQQFATSFFESIHPVYTFIRPSTVREMVRAKFSGPRVLELHDAVLLGIAALGSLFAGGLEPVAETRHTSLARSAQTCIDAELAGAGPPSLHLLASLVLKTLYLRSTGQSFAAWIASCTAMHAIASMKLDMRALDTAAAYADSSFEPRQTLFMARLLNRWIANERGQAQVTTSYDTLIVQSIPCSSAPADSEQQNVYFYHISEALSPENRDKPAELETSIMRLAALHRQHCHDGILLSRSVLALCFYRLVRSCGHAALKSETFASLVEIGLDGLEAAKRLARRRQPWWHLANAPFQFLCAMLVIDTTSSFAHIPTALQALEDIARSMPTPAVTSALQFAKQLVGVWKRRRTEQLQFLDGCLGPLHQSMPPVHAETARDDGAQMNRVMEEEEEFPVHSQMFTTEGLEGLNSLDWTSLLSMDMNLLNYDTRDS